MRPFQVMIVDDHAGVRALIRELLDECLATPLRDRPVFSESESAQDALHAAASFVPDLVTVDLRMKGLDGTQCVRQLRQTFPQAVIFVVTNLRGDSVASRTVLAGADGLVFKDDLTAIQVLAQDHLALQLLS
jgi:DNA-binding NarL/FixJ family response regulator